tara:strand:- start:711 stop:1595 length:885 start_codon:yes stop_codon:yes gene_type:complete
MQKFLNYHVDRKFNDHSLMFYCNEKLICVLPAVLQNNTLHSHPGASFSGFVVGHDVSFNSLYEIFKEFNTYCKKQFQSIVIISTPDIYQKEQDDNIKYLLSWNDFMPFENYISHYTKITDGHSLSSLLHNRKKRYIKSLIKDKAFNIKSSKNFNLFFPILKASKKEFRSKPTHSLSELQKLKRMFPNEINLFLSYQNNIVCGGTLFFYANQKSCLVFYNVVKDEYKKTQLASLQLFLCMQEAYKNNKTIIDFGVSHHPENKDPLEPKLSLIKFKEQFGSNSVLRTVYKKDFNEK